MKRIIKLLLASLLMSVLLTGCSVKNIFVAESTEEETFYTEYTPLNPIQIGQPNIYFVVKVVSSNYWQSMAKAAQTAGKELGCNVYYAGTEKETDWKGQLILLEEAIEKNADAIVLAPDDSVKLVDCIEKINEKGIPIILIDTVVNSEKYDVCYMTENLLAGQSAAKEMIAQLYKKGYRERQDISVGILVGNASSQTINERLAGFYQYWITNAPDRWTIITDIKNPDGDMDLAADMVSDLIKDNKKIAGLYGTNNGPTKVIASVVREQDKNIVVVGFDYSDEIRTLVESDDFSAATIVQRQYDMSYRAMESAKALIDGEKLSEKFVDTGIVVVNHDNYQDEDVIDVLSHN